MMSRDSNTAFKTSSYEVKLFAMKTCEDFPTKIRDKARKNKRQSIIFKPCFPLQARARTPGPGPDSPASPALSGAAALAAAALGHHPDCGAGPSGPGRDGVKAGAGLQSRGVPSGRRQ